MFSFYYFDSVLVLFGDVPFVMVKRISIGRAMCRRGILGHFVRYTFKKLIYDIGTEILML